MNLFIEKIIIEKNGQITENYSFKNKVSVVNGSIELYDIIRLLLGVYDTSHNFCNIRFFAVVKLEKTYYIRGNKVKGNSPFSVSLFSEDGETDCMEEYFKELKQSEEVESALFFHSFKRQDFPHKLFKYKDLFKYYPDGSFSHLTNGYGTTRSFRGFVANYIKHFKPIKLREDKDLFLKLSPIGEFKVVNKDNEDVVLSKSENMLYHYLSFISIADFWDRAEKIRNLNRINKPLIVSGFTRFLDDSIDVGQLVRKTKNIARQVIMFEDK